MSKQVPIAISWFFNGNLIWHFSNEAKTEEMVTQNRLLLQKMQENAPKMAQTLYLKSGNEPLRICPWCMTTLDCLCGTLVGKTELKCTKNFKALYLNFTKCNGTGFWRFGTDMVHILIRGGRLQLTTFLSMPLWKKCEIASLKLVSVATSSTHHSPPPS